MFQNTRLFNGTIRENLLVAKQDATDDELLEALKAAHALDVIDKLENKLDTVYGANGIYLSRGEQQRVILARAILKNAKIIVLDEATAFADPENEMEIQKALSNLIVNKTVIMIAHRLSTIKNADNILIINNSNIEDQGTNEALLNKSKLYSNMWKQYNKSLDWKMEGLKND